MTCRYDIFISVFHCVFIGLLCGKQTEFQLLLWKCLWKCLHVFSTEQRETQRDTLKVREPCTIENINFVSW